MVVTVITFGRNYSNGWVNERTGNPQIPRHLNYYWIVAIE